MQRADESGLLRFLRDTCLNFAFGADVYVAGLDRRARQRVVEL